MAANYVGNSVPYDPRKAHWMDMLALEMAETRYPGLNIRIVNRHGCGSVTPGATATMVIEIPV